MWAFYALLSAFFAATIDPIAKFALKKSDEYLVGWFGFLFSLPFLAILFFSNRPPVFSPALIRIIIVAMPFEVFATILYYKALRSSDIAISVPFLALTPIFAAAFAYLTMGERLSRQGMLGVCLISIGVYSLNIKEARRGLIHPVKAIFSNKGSMYMALVGMIFGVTATISKMIMLKMSPETTPFIYMASIVISMSPVIFYRVLKGRSKVERPGKAYKWYALMGVLLALSSITYFKAISTANLAYAVSIKRLSLLMSVGYGWLLFRERDVHIRFVSTLCMCIGVFLIISSTR